jgi:hypothetical protein
MVHSGSPSQPRPLAFHRRDDRRVEHPDVATLRDVRFGMTEDALNNLLVRATTECAQAVPLEVETFDDPDELGEPGCWLVGCRQVPCRLISVIAFASVDFVALLPSRNLDFSVLAIPILVFGIVAQAVLLVQFVGDLIKRSFEFFNTLDFQHAAAGSLGELLETVFFKDVEYVAFIVAWGIVNL